MEIKLRYRLIKKFGPSIFHVKIPGDILTKLNNYVDEIIKNKQKIKDLDAGKNLVGDVTQEFVLGHEFIKKSGWHTVFPFKDTNEEKRSISFNAVIDDEIYNVYGR